MRRAPFSEEQALRVGAFEYECRLEWDGRRFRVLRRQRKAGHLWTEEHVRLFEPGEEGLARRYLRWLKEELRLETYRDF